MRGSPTPPRVAAGTAADSAASNAAATAATSAPERPKSPAPGIPPASRTSSQKRLSTYPVSMSAAMNCASSITRWWNGMVVAMP